MNNKLVCRVCNFKIISKPILSLSNMPKSAQFFPNKNQFKNDKGIKINIYECDNCSLVQLMNKPVSYYKKVITAASLSDKVKELRFEEVNSLVKKYNLKGKKALEIGCATGNMLDVIQSSGLKAYGIEASKKSCLIGKKFKRKIINRFIGEVKKISYGPFDVIFCYNYFEHMPEPNKILKIISNNLRKNGIGLITVPNLNYLLKTKAHYEFVSDHLIYFTKQTIKYFFEINGFKVLKQSLINNYNDILTIIKKSKKRLIKIKKNKKKLNLNKDYRSVDKLINQFRKIVLEYKKDKKKVAIWGAGHRTLALLSLSNLSSIDYIIDSAKFKQGRFSPVLHTKIYSPETLKKKTVDLLVIMVPGIYPEEVLKSVKNMNISADIAILKDNKIVFIRKLN